MIEHEVVIAGGGPTGLMLAGELALAGVDVAVVERRENQALEGLRAGGLHIRTIEVLDQRGIADRFISQGQIVRKIPFALTALDISDQPTRHNYYLALWQNPTERTLADWVDELSVPVYRGLEVTDFHQDDTGVDVKLSDGQRLGAKYLVGCDGGRSQVRKMAGIDFPGWDPSTSYLIAEIETAREPAWGVRHGEKGINAIAKLEGDSQARVVVNEKQILRGDQPTVDDLREALIGVYGTDFGLRNAAYISRFTDATRQAGRYRNGRVLLAGDAAHVHSPVGGQGLNIGVQDAVNLGWKLGQVVNGVSRDTLLDTYHAERHPAGARMLRNTMALTAIHRKEDRIDALRELMCELVQQTDSARKHYVAMISGLDTRYDLGEGHPLLGRRMPDLDLITSDGPLRTFALLHRGRPVLLNFGEPDAIAIGPWAKRVRVIDASYSGAWELPAIGVVPAPVAVLVRPDGYVGWVGDAKQHGLTEALTTWFGDVAAP
ncbi:hypothetical protein DYQ86_11760 [Acidobacteria bacterium AB60]|nr:hypothetical protein DYQ86_11760 [Acidobacteria bacterium AB60]